MTGAVTAAKLLGPGEDKTLYSGLIKESLTAVAKMSPADRKTQLSKIQSFDDPTMVAGMASLANTRWDEFVNVTQAMDPTPFSTLMTGAQKVQNSGLIRNALISVSSLPPVPPSDPFYTSDPEKNPLSGVTKQLSSMSFSDLATVVGMADLSNDNWAAFLNVTKAMTPKQFSSLMDGADTFKKSDLINSALKSVSELSSANLNIQLSSTSFSGSTTVSVMAGFSSNRNLDLLQKVTQAMTSTQFSDLMTGAQTAASLSEANKILYSGLIKDSLNSVSSMTPPGMSPKDPKNPLTLMLSSIKSFADPSMLAGMDSLSKDETAFQNVTKAMSSDQLGSLVQGIDSTQDKDKYTTLLNNAMKNVTDSQLPPKYQGYQYTSPSDPNEVGYFTKNPSDPSSPKIALSDMFPPKVISNTSTAPTIFTPTQAPTTPAINNSGPANTNTPPTNVQSAPIQRP
jgi:hypothetical protein